MSLPANFVGKYAVCASGCWEWTAAIQSRGYGSVGIGQGQTALAHRVAYEAAVGPIPAGMTIDHLCRNKKCVNPAHLEVVTIIENVARAVRDSRPTHCPRGHEYTPENTYLRKPRAGRQTAGRECKTCRQLDRAERYAAKHPDVRPYRKRDHLAA